MRRLALTFAALAAIISGCRDNSGIRGYWSERTLNLDDYAAAEEEFADFVELAVHSPEADAFAAVDQLLRKARKDEVTYLVYAEMIMKGFGSIASPCHSCPIFLHAADNVLKKGMPSGELTARYEKRRNLCLHNNVGDVAEIPALVNGTVDIDGRRTLLLVVDQDCPSCREAMQRISSSEKWSDATLVALCYGHGPLPEAPGWEYRRLSSDQDLIDTREAPFFYVVSPDGKVEITYTTVYDEFRL